MLNGHHLTPLSSICSVLAAIVSARPTHRSLLACQRPLFWFDQLFQCNKSTLYAKCLQLIAKRQELFMTTTADGLARIRTMAPQCLRQYRQSGPDAITEAAGVRENSAPSWHLRPRFSSRFTNLHRQFTKPFEFVETLGHREFEFSRSSVTSTSFIYAAITGSILRCASTGSSMVGLSGIAAPMEGKD